MKKCISLFLSGQLLLFYFIFIFNGYSVYCFNHFGNSEVSWYDVSSNPTEYTIQNEKEIYKAIIEKGYTIEYCDTDEESGSYLIYSTNLEKIDKKISIDRNIKIEYKTFTEEKFVDSFYRFGTDMPTEELRKICSDNNVSIVMDDDTEISFFDTVVMENFYNILILFILSFIVFTIYTVLHNKKNAIKLLMGFSTKKIIKDTLLEVAKIQTILSGIAIVITSVYMYVTKRLSPLFMLWFVAGVIVLIAINQVLVFCAQFSIKSIDISNMIKNNYFSKRITLILNIFKIVIIVICVGFLTKYITNFKKLQDKYNTVIKYDSFKNYNKISSYQEKWEKENLYSEEGYKNSVKSAKQLYDVYSQKNKIILYKYGSENVLKKIGLNEEAGIDQTANKIRLFESYEDNYLITNEKYIKEYLDIPEANVLSQDGKKQPTIFVPNHYKGQEKEIKNYFIEKYNEFYSEEESKNRVKHVLVFDQDEVKIGKSQERSKTIDDVKVIYIQDGYKMSLFNDKKIDCEEIEDAIIMLDPGDFNENHYFYSLFSGNIIFENIEKSELRKILLEYGHDYESAIDSIISSLTSYIVFLKENLRNSSLLLNILFFATLFICYAENHVRLIVNRKSYAVKHILGYSIFRVLALEIGNFFSMLLILIPICILGWNYGIYIGILCFDFAISVFLYKKSIERNVYRIINGG